MDNELGRVVDALPGLVWTARPDGQADFINQRWCHYTGLSSAQALGRGWHAAIHPDDVLALLERWDAIMASEAPGDLEARMRRADGIYRWFHFRANPLRSSSGKVTKWCGVNTDIEDRKRAEQRFSPFYSTKPDGMGIGLAISRSIVESHQGRLWATPNIGPGATFEFSIPCRRSDVACAPVLGAGLDASNAPNIVRGR